MKYYVVDDNLATAMSLVNIIKGRKLGTVLGYATDPLSGKEEILEDRPDIVLVDMLMGGMDGIQLVNAIREEAPDICFVMISKVTDKEMISKAYGAGIEFFINKPINLIEVETVLGNVAEKVKMRGIMSNIRNMFDGGGEKETAKPQETVNTSDIDILFGALGMLGEKGTQDIRSLYQYMCQHDVSYHKDLLSTVADECGETKKNFEQRIRRAMKKGLSNAAAIGLDDFSNETFSVYANYVFEFKALRDEMDYLQDKTETGGRISISKFMEGLRLYGQSIK